MQLKKLFSALGLILLVATSWATGFSQCTVPLTGAVVKTDSYNALAADSGKLIAMNCTANCNLTLPSVIQAPNYTLWVSNIGSAFVTVSGNGKAVNVNASFVNIPNGEMVLVSTDGTNYFTSDPMRAADHAGIDVTTFGVRAIWTAGGLPQMTCTTTAGSKMMTCTSTTGFRVGDGVNVLNAGATNTMTTPLVPTVTPTVSTGGTFTGLVTAGATGSTPYNYCIMGWSLGGGHTACSPVGSTSSGQASLGKQTATISSIQLANNTVTVQTSTAHALLVGCYPQPCGEVFIHGTQNEGQFYGRYEAVTVPDATHLTFPSQADTRDGATADAYTGGQVVWFNQNHIKAQGNLAGNYLYAVYGRSGASLNFIGVMLPQNGQLTQATDVTYLTFDDYGATMSYPPNLPPYIPASAAATATNDNLITKIMNISGNTVTLADNAVNSVTSGTALFDNARPFAEALGYAGGAAVYFPRTPLANWAYVFRSVVTLPNNTKIVQAGTVNFYDPVEVYSTVEWHGSSTVLPCNTGGTPQFGDMCLPYVSLGGVIGFHLNASSANFNLNRVALGGSNQNQNVVYLEDGNGAWNVWRDVQCNTGWSVNDYGSRCIVARGNSDGSAGDFNTYYENVLLNDFGRSAPGESDETPSMYLSYSLMGSKLVHFSMQHRGILIRPPASGSGLVINGLYSQGGENPMVTYVNDINGTIWNALHMDQVVFDTTAVAGIVNLTGRQTDIINVDIHTSAGPGFTGEGNGGQGPWINGPNIFVNGLGYKNGVSSVYNGVAQDGIFGNGTTSGAYPQQRFGVSTAISPAFPLYTQDASPPAVATCAVTAAGPPYTQANAGWWIYYAPIYPNGGTGTVSKLGTACAATNGRTQQATVTITAIPGAIGTMWYNSDGVQMACYSQTVTTCVLNQKYGPGAPQITAGGPTGMRGPMAWTNQFYLGQWMKVGPTLFSALGTPANGVVMYCSDCTLANPCAGGGTGAFAKRLNGVWVCN